MNYIPDEDNHQHSKRIASRIKMRLRLADYFNRKNSVGPVPVTQLTQDDSVSETPSLPPFPFVSSRPENQSELTLEHSRSSSSTSSSSRPTSRDFIMTEAKKKKPSLLQLNLPSLLLGWLDSPILSKCLVNVNMLLKQLVKLILVHPRQRKE